MSALEIATISAVLSAFAIAVVAHVLALYHFVCYWASHTPQQRWTRSFLGVFALAWTRGLTEKTLRHLALFLRWEGVFILVAGALVLTDLIVRHQPNNFVPSGYPPAAQKGQ